MSVPETRMRSQVGRAAGMESTVRALLKTPPHNVAAWSESVKASSFAATLRGGGHAPPARWTTSRGRTIMTATTILKERKRQWVC